MFQLKIVGQVHLIALCYQTIVIISMAKAKTKAKAKAVVAQTQAKAKAVAAQATKTSECSQLKRPAADAPAESAAAASAESKKACTRREHMSTALQEMLSRLHVMALTRSTTFAFVPLIPMQSISSKPTCIHHNRHFHSEVEAERRATYKSGDDHEEQIEGCIPLLRLRASRSRWPHAVSSHGSRREQLCHGSCMRGEHHKFRLTDFLDSHRSNDPTTSQPLGPIS